LATTLGGRVRSDGCSISATFLMNSSPRAFAIRIAPSGEPSVTVAVSSSESGVVVTLTRSASSSGVVGKRRSEITPPASRLLRSSST
jgi:hypothetical protein